MVCSELNMGFPKCDSPRGLFDFCPFVCSPVSGVWLDGPVLCIGSTSVATGIS